MRWEACGAPWERWVLQCQLCGLHHGTTAHQRLVSCPQWQPSFINLWTHSWGEWHQHARDWLLTATTNDLKHISCLRIPSSFVATIPLQAMAQIQYRVAWFQYHILLGVTALRGTLSMPPRAPGQPAVASTSISPWFGKLRSRTVQPNPTEKNLSEQVRFCQPKRKRRPVRTPPTRCPEKQVAELLQEPLTTARKSRVLRLAHTCNSAIKQQLLDLLQGANPPIPTPPPPRPVLLLEHCTEVAVLVRDFQKAAAQSMERRHLVTHWGARMNTYLHYAQTTCSGTGASHKNLSGGGQGCVPTVAATTCECTVHGQGGIFHRTGDSGTSQHYTHTLLYLPHSGPAIPQTCKYGSHLQPYHFPAWPTLAANF